jgi:hypothetical protein
MYNYLLIMFFNINGFNTRKFNIMISSIALYNKKQDLTNQKICDLLELIILEGLPRADSKLWHGHPVWFLDDNPIVGYSVRKSGVQLMFWSGRSFDEPELTGKSRFKDASIVYTSIEQVSRSKIVSWLEKSENIQWDYKNIVKRKGELVRLK